MPAASPTRARCASATRAPCLSAPASATRSPPSSRRTARPRSRRSPKGSIARTGSPIHNGTLYIAELSQISKIDNIEANLDKPPKPTVIYNDLPKDEAHGWKFIAIGPDNKLYIPVGQPGNNVLHDKDHGQIRRINLDGTGAEVRRARRAQHGRLRLESGEQAALLLRQRAAIGCRKIRRRTNSTASPRSASISARPIATRATCPIRNSAGATQCSEFDPPVALTGPHSAGLGMRFYTGNMFPAKYKNAIFLARHGSWNRTKKFGGDVVAIFLNKDGTVKSIGAVHHRLPGRQQLHRTSGRRGIHGGRLDAVVRRLERRDLSHHLR